MSIKADSELLQGLVSSSTHRCMRVGAERNMSDFVISVWISDWISIVRFDSFRFKIIGQWGGGSAGAPAGGPGGLR